MDNLFGIIVKPFKKILSSLSEYIDIEGTKGTPNRVANAYEELVFEERQQIVGAIRGTDEWQTIWQSE